MWKNSRTGTYSSTREYSGIGTKQKRPSREIMMRGSSFQMKGSSAHGCKINYNMGGNEELVMDAHTHPTTAGDDTTYDGVVHSAKDVSRMGEVINMDMDVSDGYFKLTESGSQRFAVVITNKGKATVF
jgi:hypothetical protein